MIPRSGCGTQNVITGCFPVISMLLAQGFPDRVSWDEPGYDKARAERSCL